MTHGDRLPVKFKKTNLLPFYFSIFLLVQISLIFFSLWGPSLWGLMANGDSENPNFSFLPFLVFCCSSSSVGVKAKIKGE